MPLPEHDVVIAGGGPTGLMLAGELALAGIDVAIVERRADQTISGARAGGLHPRTLEILDSRGIVDRFLREGQKAQAIGFAGVSFDIADFPTRHPYSLGLWQNHTERILAGWVAEQNVPVYRGAEVTGFAQDEDGVNIASGDGRTLRAQYLVGCDGGRSLVRKAAGIAFPGLDPTTSNLVAEVEMAEPPGEWGTRRDAIGIHGLGRVDYEINHGRIVYADKGPVRVLVTERTIGATSEPTLDDLREALFAVYGTDFGIHSPTSISRFTDVTRQAERYRIGRVLIAGDAAHVHPPDGGHGLQTGIGDAFNLGWKLAQVVKAISPPDLLDSYEAERHPVGARVLRNTMASVLLRRDDMRTTALREIMADLLGMDAPRRRFAAIMSGLSIQYDLGHGHPLLGRRMPDLDLATRTGSRRLYTLLHDGRPLLLDFGTALDIARWADRVQHVTASYAGSWDLPDIGLVRAPKAVLIRPDGYVAWLGEGTEADLADALTAWFGPPIPS